MNEAAVRWAALQEELHALLALGLEERAGRLDALHRSDPEAARELRGLLEAHESTGPLAMLDRPVFAVPERVGPFRIEGPLGEGGMGTVWLAERRQEDFSQRVALKLLRTGLIDPALEERLKVERRILARLDHPGIARFIDGGATAAGQPYYAMEYVEGTTVLEYCRTRKLTIAERLELFVQICDAVHYAHQQLVVHRDLKPGNLLVTDTGQPKLLDFGVAKLMVENPDGDPTATARWMTPAYASPEQVRGEPASTLSDVYALGVILFEMLTGRRPYEIPGRSPVEIQRAVCETIPPRPSAAVEAAAAYPGGPERAARALAGDLDMIVLKSLAKEPARRYTLWEQMAQDIRRHLQGHPVLARPDRLGYRIAKFVGRHRVPVAFSIVLAVALVAGIVVTSSLAARASRERDRAQEALRQSDDVTRFLQSLFASSSPDRTLTDTLAGREVLRRGLELVEELRDPAVQARTLGALANVYERLGQYSQAGLILERALGLQRAALGGSHADVAATLDLLGVVRRRTGAYTEAERLHREALDIRRRLFGDEHLLVAETIGNLAFLMPYLGRGDEAEALYQEVLRMRRRLQGPNHPELANTMISIASLMRKREAWDDSEALYREALALRTRVDGADHPETGAAMAHLGDFLRDVRADSAEAERLYRTSIAIQRARRPNHPTIVHAMGSLVELLRARGRVAEARPLMDEILGLVKGIFGDTHPSVAGAHVGSGTLFEAEGNLAAAESLYRKALEINRRLYGGEHFTVAEVLQRLAGVEVRRGNWARAESLGRASVEMHRRVLEPVHGNIPTSLMWLANLLQEEGKTAEARELYLEALTLERGRKDSRTELIGELESRLAGLPALSSRPAARATPR